MGPGQCEDVPAGTCFGRGGDGFAAWGSEFGVAGAIQLEPVAALVHQSVMMPAQQQQVIETGLAAVRPVLYVMGVDVMARGAARKKNGDALRKTGTHLFSAGSQIWEKLNASPLIQCFPKVTDLSAHSPAELNRVARRLNERLRKTPDYETLADRFAGCVASTI